MKMRLAALGALIAAAATTACGRGTGTVRPLLTDAPAPANVQKVLITINEVRIKDEAEDAENRNEPDDDKPGLNGSPATHPEAEQDGVRGKGWIVLCTGLQTFDARFAFIVRSDRGVQLVQAHESVLDLNADFGVVDGFPG